jgi:hypothetical protein
LWEGELRSVRSFYAGLGWGKIPLVLAFLLCCRITVRFSENAGAICHQYGFCCSWTQYSHSSLSWKTMTPDAPHRCRKDHEMTRQNDHHMRIRHCINFGTRRASITSLRTTTTSTIITSRSWKHLPVAASTAPQSPYGKMEQSGGIVCLFCRLLQAFTWGNRLLILLLHVCIYTECCMSANSDSLDSTSDANESPYVTLQHQILRRSRVPFADRQRQTECHDPFGAGILFAVSVDKIVKPLYPTREFVTKTREATRRSACG